VPRAQAPIRRGSKGKVKEIAEYCEADVIGTYRVWLRYELFRYEPPAADNQFDLACDSHHRHRVRSSRGGVQRLSLRRVWKIASDNITYRRSNRRHGKS
jgi:hypothetical protein